ncbi:abortive infection family protein [Endomicrobium proavitum]|uniref:Abortive infection protein-like C-terminal domain-containing protein n=1 Tax=Endomicrobium proavitum TaxID=1408281 RepID=A0A0G3WJU1_9BACT|nr:abortive infection family protein [Endomicrobium proavitum]AKL98137.1 hypothetical protein Epro_0758 [Endomicrobium proavitum]
MTKENLILDNYIKKINYPHYEMEKLYIDLYEEFSDKYKIIFSYFHQELNKLFEFMNYKITVNRHFNAESSRVLITMNTMIIDLVKALKKESVEIIVNDSYKAILGKCSKFLSNSGGSTIPDTFTKIDIILYDPIFYINNATMHQANSVKELFNSEYMNQQISVMIDSIHTNTADAIGKSKELIETCCKTILATDDKSLDIPALMKKVKGKLNLNSKNESVNKIIGNLSGVAAGIAELRNAKGTGHGKNIVKFKPPSKIEAQLSVDVAIALTRFLWCLYESKNVR